MKSRHANDPRGELVIPGHGGDVRQRPALQSVALYAPGVARITRAQDKPLVCDSTLVTLLLVAEHNYDYLTNMEKSGAKAPAIEFGDYKPLLENIMAMMMEQQKNMTQEQMDAAAAEDKMMGEMMAMSNADLIKEYLKSMKMEGGAMDAMTALPTGALASEDPACTTLRSDVEHFLLLHTIGDMMMGAAMK